MRKFCEDERYDYNNFMGEMNLENQLQVAFATLAELREQIYSLTRVNWFLEELLHHDAESREEMRCFYENQMENLRMLLS